MTATETSGPGSGPGSGARERGGSAERPLWAARFSTPPAPEAAAFGRSLGFDVRLAPYDVEASIAHAHALEDAGVLEAAETAALVEALSAVGEEIAAGTFAYSPVDEDLHSAIERGVTARLGELGAKLHAGRSRNDLVMADVRSWLLDVDLAIDDRLRQAIGTLLERAREHAGTVMAGTTHLRPAQPVTLGHHLLAHAWGLARDLERFEEHRRRSSVSPLGAGALATSTLPIDPAATAGRLGFDRAFENSIDAVSDRDAIQEFLADAAICATHLSRLAADVARLSDPTLGWASLDDAWATGSSMMPQKRNPDVAELGRAKAGRVLGDLVTVTTVLHGLPLGYHRDLQEDKEALFDAADSLLGTVEALSGCIASMTFDRDAMRKAAGAEELFATDLAEALVARGLPFREAHGRVGRLLAKLEAEGRSLASLDAAEWMTFGVPDGASLLDPDRAVAARAMAGGPSPASVAAQIAALEQRLVAGSG